jgi:hypothetical protein
VPCSDAAHRDRFFLLLHLPPALGKLEAMTGRQFYDWQTAGGADDVMKMVDALERAELHGAPSAALQ